MGWQEIERRLAPRFEIVAAKGFNMSFHLSVDDAVRDLDVAKEWAACCEDRPDLANGVIVQCRRREDWRRPQRELRDLGHRDPQLRWYGAWSELELHQALTGRLGLPGASLGYDFVGTETILQFWCHPWSGIARIEVDGVPQEVDLYSPVGGFRRHVVEGLDDGTHRVFVLAPGRAGPCSGGTDVILHHVICGRASG
jgi:hypothetical protein